MSEGRRYNFRSRKTVDYSGNLGDRESENVEDTPRSKTRAKGITSQKPRSKVKLQSTRSNATKAPRQKVKKVELEPPDFSSDDDFSFHKRELENEKHHTAESNSATHKTDLKREPTKFGSTHKSAAKDVRKRVPEARNYHDNTLYHSAMKDVYSTDDEQFTQPDSTVPEFGEISPIQHEQSVMFTIERRDKLMSGRVSRDPKPVLKKIRHKSKEEVMQDFQTSLKWQILWSLLGLIVISALAVAAMLKFEDVRSAASSSRRSRLESRMEMLKVQFPSQTFRFWNVLGGASLSHVKHPSRVDRPIVVLLTGTKESAETMGCLAKKVAVMFNDMFESSASPTAISGGSFTRMETDTAKRKIDNKLRTGFKAGGKTAVVHNVDNIPPCSILLFHSYCENENAPYKDVAIIMTLQLGVDDVDLDDLSLKEFDAVVSNHLKARWSECQSEELPPDKQDAMLARVANNVARVKAEDKYDLKTVCQSG